MATTQDDRLLKIETPLEKDFLLLNKFYATEKLSGLFEISVELLHEEEEEGHEPTDVDIQSILGKGVSITVTQDDGVARNFNGMVNQFSQGNRSTRFTYYSATIVPHVWLLTQKSQSRIFQHKSVQEILEEVFDGFEVVFQIQGDFERRNYCVQYRETDFNFASRLMEEEGFYYYFEHTEGNHKMIIANTPQSHQDNPGKNEIDYQLDMSTEEGFVSVIRDIKAAFKLQTGAIAFRDRNFQLPGNMLSASVQSMHKVGDNHNLEVYEFPGGYARKYDGKDRMGGDNSSGLDGIFPDKDRTLQNTMEALDSQFEVLSGASNCCALTGGYRFNLEKHPKRDRNRQYVLTSVSHRAEQSPTYVSDEDLGESYLNSFSCIPHGAGAPPFRPERVTPKPIVQGSQTAVVVGPAGEEIFTDEFGRIKVQFPWDRQGQVDADSSCWMRVTQSWAGNGWGSMFIPRIGMEVVVDFLEGDPDQPIVGGCVYNPDMIPPYPLPDEKTKSGVKSDSSKGGGGFNEIRFEDKKGEEQVFVHAQKDLDMRIKNDRRELVANDRHTFIQRDKREHIKRDEHKIVERDTYHQYEKKVHTRIMDTYHKLHEKDVTEQNYENVDVAIIKNYTIDVGQKVSIAAGEIVLDASTAVTLKCGGNFIKVHPGGVDIVGSMVKINSGGAAGSASSANLCPVTEPEKALIADNADPGSKSPTYKNQIADRTRFEKMMYGSSPSHNPNSSKNEDKKSWIEIKLEDDEGNPVPGEKYLVTLPDGSTVASGTLDSKGEARVESIDPGNCQITFPDMDGRSWEKK
ncbi:MAG: type VI secretion system tip protein VgrG [Pyrinomonadaceae bacterium]|nr:type VI secretion system tip protein VgrG [Pyrinomonadaceae bacterium]